MFHPTQIEQLRARAVLVAEKKFGKESVYNEAERARRGLEEAVEFAQALGVEESQALSIVMHIYSKKPGNKYQELSGLFFTMLLSATALNANLHDVIVAELDRVEAIPQDMVDAKQDSNAALGISSYRGR
jgi:hypothetical protein